MMSLPIVQVLDEASIWMDVEGVEGIAEGRKDGNPCIVVFVSIPASKLKSIIPDTFMNYTVVFEESGIIKAQ
jgi:hypothetical protein